MPARWFGVRKFAAKKPLGAAGAAIVLVLVVVSILAPLLAPYDPNESLGGARLLAPSGDHWMGTDNLGRDLMSRLIYGARISLVVGLGASIIGTVVGVLLGLLSGYAGGIVDEVMQRSIDSMMAFPGLIAIALGSIPSTTRVVRGAVLGVKRDAKLASRALGATGWRIAFFHLLLNIAVRDANPRAAGKTVSEECPSDPVATRVWRLVRYFCGRPYGADSGRVGAMGRPAFSGL